MGAYLYRIAARYDKKQMLKKLQGFKPDISWGKHFCAKTVLQPAGLKGKAKDLKLCWYFRVLLRVASDPHAVELSILEKRFLFFQDCKQL